MSGVEQSGNVTPGHYVKWFGDGVVGDGGGAIASQKVLASLLSADFNTIADQPIEIPASITAFQLTGILVTNTTLSLSTAEGGFYPQPAKAGTPLVAASQVYSTLTGANVLLSCTLESTVATTRYSIANLPNQAIYFALTTAQGANAYADIYILGVDLTA